MLFSSNRIRPGELIDELIKRWEYWDEKEEYYLKKLAPSIVINPNRETTNEEKRILNKLRGLLNQEEWLALPKLIAERRAGILREFEIEQLAAFKRIEEDLEKLRRESLQKQAEAKRNELFNEIRIKLQRNFLSADSFFQDSCASYISLDEYEQEKIAFIKLWVSENGHTNKNGEKQSLDDEQATAIAAVHGHVQVIARAGSGKTTTLVNRTLFLLKHCRVAPSEMLILAFNRKAVLEIRRRLLGLLSTVAEAAVSAEIELQLRKAGKKTIDKEELEIKAIESVVKKQNIALPHVMTFHALGYAIVHPEQSLLYNDAEGESQELNRVFQKIIDAHLQEPDFKSQIRKVMLAHFREDWDRIVEGCYDGSKEDFLQFRRSLSRKSLRGEYVKSYGEKVIANFLFEHGIHYIYEYNHWWSGINYRPDFSIFHSSKGGIVIEYFGLKGDNDYDEMVKEKRDYWITKKEWKLIEFSPYDIVSNGVDSFPAVLKKCLEDRGIPCIRLSEDEIWHRIEDREIDRFTKVIDGFISKCRKYSLFPAKLRSLIDNYSPISPIEGTFLELAYHLYIEYLERLCATGEDDFNGLMQRSAAAINTGQTIFQKKSGSGDLSLLRYICIDEFQDFSDLFFRLLCSIQEKNSGIEIFCVGDDWQAINGFAGSDLRFFENFSEHVGESRQLYISTNYRSSKAIVDVGNTLMKGLGRPAVVYKKDLGKISVSDLNDFEPTFLEKERHPGDSITPTILRLASKALADGLDIVMLCRRNEVPWFVNYKGQNDSDSRGLDRYLDLVRSFLPKDLRERISISTVHKYKGLEKRMVIVLDAVARSYPLIHPNWVFSRLLGDNLEKIVKEERRLLYVALTRAVEKLVIITDGRGKSPFLEEIERSQPLSEIDWADYPPVSDTTSRLVVKVGNQNGRDTKPTLDIKHLLKNVYDYEWQPMGWRGWAKSFSARGFSIEMVKAESWVEIADGVEIRIFDYTNTLVACYLLNKGQWMCELDNLAQIQTDELWVKPNISRI